MSRMVAPKMTNNWVLGCIAMKRSICFLYEGSDAGSRTREDAMAAIDCCIKFLRFGIGCRR